MSDKQKTAKELCQGHAGAFQRRREIILALCGATPVTLADSHTKFVAENIVAIANRIIELTEQ